MKLAILCALVAAVSSTPVQDIGSSRNLIDNAVDCLNSDVTLCLKEQALKIADRLSGARKFKLAENVVLSTNADLKGRSLEPLSSEYELRKKQVNQRLWETTSEILQNTELEYSYGDAESDESRAIGDAEESRGKKKGGKKKLKMLLPLAILAKIKGSIMSAIFLGVIAFSLFKIMAMLKVAFLAKVLGMAKMLLAHKHDLGGHGDVSFGHVEEHDHHHHSGGGGGGGYNYPAPSSGWSRSRNEAQDLAYAAQKPIDGTF